jgi:hypothetical protein
MGKSLEQILVPFRCCGTIWAAVALWSDAGKRAYAKITKLSGFIVSIPVAPNKFHRENRSAGRIARHVSISMQSWLLEG